MNNFSQLLEQIAGATSLREGPEGVAQVLRRVYLAHAVALKELAVRCSLPLPVVAAVRRELEKKGLLERQGGKIALTALGRDFVEQQLMVRTRHSPVCPTCEGRGIVIGEEMRPVVEKLAGYFTRRPVVDTTLDQAPCLPETSIRRVLLMHEAGAIEGKNVLFLGDDDSISLAAGLMGNFLGEGQFARRLTVVEADPRILDHLNKAAQAEGLAIECIPHDLREPLPDQLRGRFDTFETDPPYTVGGASLFLSRGISGLKPGVGSQAFLSYGAKSPDESLELAQALADMGLSSARILPGFNRYEGASILGGMSQMLHLLATSSTQPIPGEDSWSDPIYTGEASPTLRLYRCRRCKTDVVVGRGQRFDTIERLKTAGCPRCGNATFSYQRRMRRSGSPVARRNR